MLGLQPSPSYSKLSHSVAFRELGANHSIEARWKSIKPRFPFFGRVELFLGKPAPRDPGGTWVQVHLLALFQGVQDYTKYLKCFFP